jgi:sulfate adenylyltransferase subunit 2
MSVSELDRLEAESMHVMREVAAELERPVLLFSGGKDSLVLLQLAVKAFRPGAFPFPILHVDTGHNFPEVIEFRDRLIEEIGEQLIVASVQEAIDAGRVKEEGPSRNRLQTAVLLEAIEDGRFDAAFGGARRDEERARAKERVFSFRDEFGQWDPRAQRPEVWNVYNGRVRAGEHVRVFPLSSWTELDVWHYIQREELELPSIYMAHERRVFERDGMLLAESEWLEPEDGEEVFDAKVRYRTVGDMTVTGAVRGEATELEDVIAEIATRGSPSAARRAPTTASPPPRWRTASARATSDGPAAPRHRRIGRRRQVDADRSPAARREADPRGPARGPEQPQRRRARPRLDDRRPARRARAGHHDRCRLPLLPDRQALVHHRRHAGP